MTDHELLELAAKAAGIEIHESDDGTLQKRPIWAVTHFVCGQPYGESQWNPLTDDGDARFGILTNASRVAKSCRGSQREPRILIGTGDAGEPNE